MNKFAYRTTGIALKAFSGFSRAKIKLHDPKNIPEGAVIFVINHFTRIETILIPYHIYQVTKIPVWSLADDNLFKGALGAFMEKVGAVSTRNPERDKLMVKSLLTGEASWIIYPEGRMVKNKKIVEKGKYMISYAGGKHPPHTGAAILALRTEFYRQRLRRLAGVDDGEVKRLLALFGIESIAPVLDKQTFIVPVNVTYYPVRARENILSHLAARFVEDIPERMMEELMTEGTMVISGVDVDIRFGLPINIREYIQNSKIQRDVDSPRKFDFDDPIRSKKRLKREALRIMQRYMHSIYSMTTINTDHLFASLVRSTPYKTMTREALNRRVFLTATDRLDRKGIFRHRSLTSDQTHLLTDDRFKKSDNFFSIAVEKGVLIPTEKGFIKNRKKLISPFDFHRVRIENPIAVMANAVEPLKNLQRSIRRFSLLPDFVIRRLIVKQLRKRDMDAFEADYRKFFVKGESKEKEIGRPYLVRGRSNAKGVLLVHGYMAAPFEVRELADYLGRQGLFVYAMRITGHGTSPDDLATRDHMDWVESVDRGYAIVANRCKKVFAGGFSTGAGLALDLAARVEGLSGVFAVCPPLKLQSFSSRFASSIDTWNRMVMKVGREGAAKEFVQNSPENPHINYKRNPIAGVSALERLMDQLEPKLPRITIPARVIQGSGDPVVDPRGSKKVFERLGAQDKQYIVLNFDRHGIVLGDGAEKVHRHIYRFIRETE